MLTQNDHDLSPFCRQVQKNIESYKHTKNNIGNYIYSQEVTLLLCVYLNSLLTSPESSTLQGVPTM